MLTLANPVWLWLFALFLPVVALYFLRRRFRNRTVPSLYLWARLADRSDGGGRFRMRSMILLLLQLIAIAGAAISLSGPAAVRDALRAPGVAFLVDVSASMGAGSADSGSLSSGRMADAKDAALRELERLGPETPAAVFACGSSLTLVSPPSLDRKAARAAVASLEPNDAAFVEETVATSLSAWMAERDEAWAAVLVSDGGLSLGGRRIAALFGNASRAIMVGGEDRGLGIAEPRIEAADSGAFVSFLARNGHDGKREVELTIERDGIAVARLPLTLAPGLSRPGSRVPFAPIPGAYRFSVRGGASPATPPDEGRSAEAFLVFGEAPPPRVLVVGGRNPYILATLEGSGADYRYSEAFPNPFDGAEWDLVVADRIPVGAGIACSVLGFGVIPGDAALSFGEAATGRLEGTGPAHPLSRFLDLGSVRLRNGRSLLAAPGMTVLAKAGGASVAVAWTQSGFRRVVFGFDLSESDLGFSPAFPVFARNLLDWCVPRLDANSAFTIRVGEPSRRIAGSDPRSTDESLTIRPADGKASVVEASRAGILEYRSGNAIGKIAANVPASELDLEPRRISPFMKDAAWPDAIEAPEMPEARTGRIRAELAPAFILLFLASLAAEWLLWHGLPARGRRGKPSFAAMRLSAVACISLALAGMPFVLPSRARFLVALMDISDSIGPAGIEKSRRSAIETAKALNPGDRMAVVAFNGKPLILVPPCAPSVAASSLESIAIPSGDRGGSDLAGALELARSLAAKGEGAPFFILYGDGRYGAGYPAGAGTAASGGIPLWTVPEGEDAEGAISRGLELPADAKPGEATKAVWRIFSGVSGKIAYSFHVDGRENRAGEFELVPGMNRIPLEFDPGNSGVHELRVKGGIVPGAATVEDGAILEVSGPRRVLVVSDRAGSPVGRALGIQGMSATAMEPESLPETLAGYSGFSAVVLDDIPAGRVTASQMERLADFVSGGGGLLAIGGEHSLGRGEYRGTLLEEMLPVRTDTRRRIFFTRAKLLFVIDRSGSMSESVGGATKQEAAMRGVAAAAGELSPQDEIGILSFDSGFTWDLRFTRASEKERIISSLGRVSEGGGTDLSQALEEALRGFGDPGPEKRHIVLLTDGYTRESDFLALTDRLKASGVSLSVIAIGRNVNEELLKGLAEANGGRYRRAEADRVPAIIDEEAVEVSRDLVREGTVRIAVDGYNGITDGLRGELPPVRGYLATIRKPLSEVPIEAWFEADPVPGASRSVPGSPVAGTGDPFLATWMYGAGRTAVIASDSGARWLSAWSGRPEYNRLWSQVTRSLSGRGDTEGLRVFVATEGGQSRLVAEARGPDGKTRPGLSMRGSDSSGGSYALAETAPGRYEAIVASWGGAMRFDVSDPVASVASSAWSFGTSGSEAMGLGPDLPALERLSSESGGRLVREEYADPGKPRFAWRAIPARGFLLFLALCLMIAELFARSVAFGRLGEASRALGAWIARERERARAARASWLDR